MNRSTLIVLAAGAGCATHVPVPATTLDPHPTLEDGFVDYDEWQQTRVEVNESLDRLAALQLLDVSAMVVDAPAASGHCYGPCPEDPVDQTWLQEHARQAQRLGAFVDLAESMGDVYTPQDSMMMSEAEAAVEALNALQIVEVESIHITDGGCYVAVCPADYETVSRAQALVEAAQGL